MGIFTVDSFMKIFAFSLLFAISYISFAGAHPEEADQVKDLASCLDYVDQEFERGYEAKIYDKREKDFVDKCYKENYPTNDARKKEKDCCPDLLKRVCSIAWIMLHDDEIFDAYDDCRKKYKR